VIVKRVNMPAMSPEQLHEQIGWEAEQYIPFDVNEVNLDFQILEPDAGDGQMEILLVAAKRDLIDDYVQVVAEAGLTLAAIDVASFALGNAFEANYESEGSDVVALVNVGAQVVNINVVSEGLPAFTRDISTAGNQYTEEIQKTLSVSFDEAERLKLGAGGGAGQEMLPQEVDHAMRAVTESVVGEIGRSLDFFAASSVESRISRVLLSGGTSRVAGFEEAFRERSGVPVEVMNPLTRMLPSSRFDQDFLDSVAPSLGVGVGLALREVSA
jgi:type IV pilus assembly protein PilM